MKILLSLTFMLLLNSQKSIGQNKQSDLMPKLIELKMALKLRANKVFSFTNELLKSGNSDKKSLINKSNLLAKELMLYIDSTKSLDTILIKTLFIKNENLTNSVKKILVSMETLLDKKNEKAFTVFFAELDTAERSINKAKRNYNAACKAAKREDLQYVNPNPDEDIEVKF